MPGISDLLDSDMEENNFIDENSIISSVSDGSDAANGPENGTATKKSKKRHRVTIPPKTKSRTVKSPPASAPAAKRTSKKTATTKRKAPEDGFETNIIADSQQNVAEQDEEGMEVEGPAQPKRKPVAKKTARKAKTDIEQVCEEGMEVEQTPMVARSNFARGTSARTAPKVIKTTKTTTKKVQKEPVADVQSELVQSEIEFDDELAEAAPQPPLKRARTESRSRQEPTFRRRAGSASDTERGDPNLRRKLGDVTRKFENIDMRYKNLKEVGISEANANVEKLRKQCEATTEASNNLITSLKKELAQQTTLAQEARKVKAELKAREDELARLQVSQTELNASLTSAHNEIRALQAKLTVARTAPTSIDPQPTKTPGSAMKTSRPAAIAHSEATQTAQAAQMKLDLYGDLTGLIVRSVKRSADGDTFECIQTGRNGTLHFKLFIDQEDAKSASFEDTEFLYTPLLDADRDRDMIDLMPPYLAEDITFSRQNAAKFYQRVVDTLTRRTEDV